MDIVQKFEDSLEHVLQAPQPPHQFEYESSTFHIHRIFDQKLGSGSILSTGKPKTGSSRDAISNQSTNRTRSSG
jgi:hypothetical protein